MEIGIASYNILPVYYMFKYQVFMLSVYSGIMHNNYVEYSFLPMIRFFKSYVDRDQCYSCKK